MIIEQRRCDFCSRALDNPDDVPASVDCGGTCRHCMASLVGDPDEIANMGWPIEDDES